MELEPIESKIQVLIGQNIINEAEKLDVETPSYRSDSDLWTSSRYSGTVNLSPKGRSHLRKLIDEEKARRFEVKVRWIKLLVPLITALAGLIGVITGLVSVSRR